MDTPSFTRRLVIAVLAVAAALMLAASVLTLWTDHVLLDEDRFSARVSSSLEDDVVSDYIAAELTSQVISHAPDLITVRPAIEIIVREAVSTNTAIAGARTAVREAHRAIRAGQPDEAIVLDLRAAFALADVLLTENAPEVAERLPRGFDTARIDGSVVGLNVEVFDRLDDLTAIIPVLVLGSLVLLLSIVRFAPTPRGGVLIAGVALAAGGGIGLLGQRITEEIFIGLVPSPDAAGPAVTAMWHRVLADYYTWNLFLVAAGLFVSVGAFASGRAPSRAEVREVLTESPWARAVGGAALAFTGLAIVRWPVAALTAVAVAIGLAIGLVGLALLMRSILDGIAASRETLGAVTLRSPRLFAPAFAGIAAVALVSILGVWFVSGIVDDDEPPPPQRPAITACNGHPALCDVPLNQVVFAGTHNSMAAAAEPGWYFPAHRYGIVDQLRAGIRTLLIDTYYGEQTSRGVRTVIDEQQHREYLIWRHGEEMVNAWERIANRLLPGQGQRGMFLCHSFCELGATPMQAALANIRDFLNAQPGEFVVIFVQDQTSPEDTVAEFERAGLADRAYAHPEGEPWPTLGELLENGKQLFIMAEAQAGAAAWYQYAWTFTEDTPYDSPSPEAFSCTQNRGAPGNDFFLMNHWVAGEGPLPATALEVNQYDVLMDRVRECEEERGRTPNFIAVDFYDAGDVLDLVAELNGIAASEVQAR